VDEIGKAKDLSAPLRNVKEVNNFISIPSPQTSYKTYKISFIVPDANNSLRTGVEADNATMT
jgi:hypothetical protein